MLHSYALRHRLRNALHTLAALGSLLALTALIAGTLVGPQAALWASLAVALVTFLAPRPPAAWMAARLGARPVHRGALRGTRMELDVLARRANLPATPELHVIPSPQPQAMAVGTRNDAVIAVTTGLVQKLTPRELRGVLAHEVSHLRRGDTSLMTLASALTRWTRTMAWLGALAMLLALPLALLGVLALPWGALPLWLLAPLSAMLLERALSRTREFNADAEAVTLTGDPDGLASALARIDRSSQPRWARLLGLSARPLTPELLRTHPSTASRIARLRELTPSIGYHPAHARQHLCPARNAPWRAASPWAATPRRGNTCTHTRM